MTDFILKKLAGRLLFCDLSNKSWDHQEGSVERIEQIREEFAEFARTSIGKAPSRRIQVVLWAIGGFVLVANFLVSDDSMPCFENYSYFDRQQNEHILQAMLDGEALAEFRAILVANEVLPTNLTDSDFSL